MRVKKDDGCCWSAARKEYFYRTIWIYGILYPSLCFRFLYILFFQYAVLMIATSAKLLTFYKREFSHSVPCINIVY